MLRRIACPLDVNHGRMWRKILKLMPRAPREDTDAMVLINVLDVLQHCVCIGEIRLWNDLTYMESGNIKHKVTQLG